MDQAEDTTSQMSKFSQKGKSSSSRPSSGIRVKKNEKPERVRDTSRQNSILKTAMTVSTGNDPD